jgi:hypothetical protein
MDHRGNRRRGNRRDSQPPVRRHRQPLRRSHSARRVLLQQTMKMILRMLPRMLRARKMMKMLIKMKIEIKEELIDDQSRLLVTSKKVVKNLRLFN